MCVCVCVRACLCARMRADYILAWRIDLKSVNYSVSAATAALMQIEAQYYEKDIFCHVFLFG